MPGSPEEVSAAEKHGAETAPSGTEEASALQFGILIQLSIHIYIYICIVIVIVNLIININIDNNDNDNKHNMNNHDIIIIIIIIIIIVIIVHSIYYTMDPRGPAEGQVPGHPPRPGLPVAARPPREEADVGPPGHRQALIAINNSY